VTRKAQQKYPSADAHLFIGVLQDADLDEDDQEKQK
jgi:hypothetical protein